MDIFFIGLIAATLRVATPLIFGTLGELFAERAGILNLGIEGTLFFARLHRICRRRCHRFIMAGSAGGADGRHSRRSIDGSAVGVVRLKPARFRPGHHVAANRDCHCMVSARYMAKYVCPPPLTHSKKLSPFGNTPVLGPIFEQYALTYLAVLLVPVVWWVLYRTSFGLKIRAVGENPEAADAAGVNVYLTRYLALAIGGGLMAVGGAFLSIAQLGAFTFGIIAGRGWVCIALIIFAQWLPVRVLLGALLFGGVFALQLRLQMTGLKLPYEVFLALPYLVTILALAIAGRNANYPGAYLKPYRRE